jgi:hypothetical protein
MAKFKPGQSGNPAGRPRGSVTHKNLREAITKNLPDIVEAMIQRAKAGDTSAAKLLIDRVLAPMKAGDAHIKLSLKGNLSQDAHEVLKAVGASELTPGQANTLLGAISALARIKEVDELEARISKLESGEKTCHPLNDVLNNLKERRQQQV